MNKNLLMKAVPAGLLLGIVSTLAVVGIRMLLRGGSFFDHLFSVYSILTLISVPIAWVARCFDKYKEQESN